MRTDIMGEASGGGAHSEHELCGHAEILEDHLQEKGYLEMRSYEERDRTK
jgi:hypothetical protein